MPNEVQSLEDQVKVNEQRVKDREERLERQKQRNLEIASRAKEVQASWEIVKTTPAAKHLYEFILAMKELHLRNATDGMGVKVVGRDEEGKEILETVVLTPEQQLRHINQASGIEEVLNYLDRRIS